MNTTRRVYAYTHPGYANEPWSRTIGGSTITGTGLIKAGQTTRETGLERIREQTKTPYPDWNLIRVYFDEPAQRPDGSYFTDHELHKALTARGIARRGEWFEATEAEVREALVAVRAGRQFASGRTEDYAMRPEQVQAVHQTAAYFRAHADDTHPPRYLWNAKMRFGKTFTTYQLAREMEWRKVLVLTFKPAVQHNWRTDLLSHVDFDGWQFVDKNTPFESVDTDEPLVWFASLQDTLGRDENNHVKAHNTPLHLLDWDAIVIDEYHFGAWRDSSKNLYDPSDEALADAEQDDPLSDDTLGLKARFRLFLSGTPFRALTEGEFSEDQIFNWTYIDEQRAKEQWNSADGPNQYAALPRMEMYTYKVPAAAEQVADEGEFDGFDLSAYFKATKVTVGQDSLDGSRLANAYAFANETRVVEFLNMLRGKLTDQMKADLIAGDKPPFPFEDDRFNGRLNHTVWYLPDVAACYAMAAVLGRHPYFADFAVHVAAGPKAGLGDKALPPVQQLIDHHTQTITLSCGKLMTGVTVPQWSGILMLRSQKSPESYFQAAFRVQSPWTGKDNAGATTVLKDTVYVFDFDPNRALSLVAEYGSKLATLGDASPKDAITELINYLPIFAFDGSSMEQLDAGAVLDWATAGTGATMLARRWRDARLVDLNDAALAKLLADEDLVKSLEQMEDFRNLSSEVTHIITSNKKLREAKAKNDGKLSTKEKHEQKENASRRKLLRDKLLKFLSRVPVFMYLTDYREESLQDIIEGLDTRLFERVTGLTLADFTALKEAGVFSAGQMNAAIYQFKLFEDSSLVYVSDRIGLWDRSVSRTELAGMTPPQVERALTDEIQHDAQDAAV